MGSCEVIRLKNAVAANLGEAALARSLSDVQGLRTEGVGRMLLADASGLTAGHTTPPVSIS